MIISTGLPWANHGVKSTRDRKNTGDFIFDVSLDVMNPTNGTNLKSVFIYKPLCPFINEEHSSRAFCSQICEGGWKGQLRRLLTLPLPNMTTGGHNDWSSRSHKPSRLENRLAAENTCWKQSFPPFESTLKGRQSPLDDLEAFLKVWPGLCIWAEKSHHFNVHLYTFQLEGG